MANNEIVVGIQTFTELLSVLEAENKVFLKGQLIWAIDDVTGSLKKGLKVGDFDEDTMSPGAGTPFISLDWQIKPDNAGADGFTPFPIERADPQFDDTTGDTIITDSRLIGVTTAMVYATDRGTHFRKNEKVIDPALGTITLPGYSGMGPDDQLLIFIPSAIVVTAALTALAARVADLEVYARPFVGAGAKVVWDRPRNTIPPGWREWQGIRGKIPVPQDPADLVNPALAYDATTNPSINGTGRPLGSTGGTPGHTITGTNYFPKFRLFTVVNQTRTANDHPADTGRQITGIRSFIKFWFKTDAIGKESYELMGSNGDNDEPTISPTSWIGQDTPDEINHQNPYQLVHYIERDI